MSFEIHIFKKHKHWETYFNVKQSFLIGKKVRRSRLFDTPWRNIVFGVFLGKVENLLGANEYIYILDTQDTLNLCQRYGEIPDGL